MQTRCIKAEYIWLDGAEPVQQIRSKTKVVSLDSQTETVSLSTFGEWGFDGSSTFQATGHDSDLVLSPCSFYRDPLRSGESYLVLCEVNTPDNRPHSSNKRAALRGLLQECQTSQDPWAGFEQEYTFLDQDGRPLGADTHKFMRPQGPFYCAVGADVAFGRQIVEEHLDACINAGLLVYGTNGEVMPGQWEFQVGYRGNNNENSGILEMSDQLWVARHLLHLIAERHNVVVSYSVKPVQGDWNGAGMHTNFSTVQTRDPKRGSMAIEEAVLALSKRHGEHIAQYGFNNEQRLTGKHETCDIHTFRSGVADRGSSIRIPRSVSTQGCGYLEDRRPGANANPYAVSSMLVETICIRK
jgi:glutamine synthetase